METLQTIQEELNVFETLQKLHIPFIVTHTDSYMGAHCLGKELHVAVPNICYDIMFLNGHKFDSGSVEMGTYRTLHGNRVPIRKRVGAAHKLVVDKELNYTEQLWFAENKKSFDVVCEDAVGEIYAPMGQGFIKQYCEQYTRY